MEWFRKRRPTFATYMYLSKIAEYQRENGNMVSSAQIIEAVHLATSLANLHDGKIPTLKDIKRCSNYLYGTRKLLRTSFSNGEC